MSLKKQIFILTIGFFILTTPFAASARGLVPCGGYEANGKPENPCTVEDIFVLVARTTNFLIAMAGVFAVYEIIGAGFWLVVSTGNEEDITKRKGQLSSAIVGLGMVMFAFMFINTVVNFMLTRSIVTDPRNPNYNANCKLDLRNPLNYITINQRPCSNVGEPQVHNPPKQD